MSQKPTIRRGPPGAEPPPLGHKPGEAPAVCGGGPPSAAGKDTRLTGSPPIHYPDSDRFFRTSGRAGAKGRGVPAPFYALDVTVISELRSS